MSYILFRDAIYGRRRWINKINLGRCTPASGFLPFARVRVTALAASPLLFRHGRHGTDWPGAAELGWARYVLAGEAGRGFASRCRDWLARRVWARCGTKWPVNAGGAWSGRHGKARQAGRGRARRGEARRGHAMQAGFLEKTRKEVIANERACGCKEHSGRAAEIKNSIVPSRQHGSLRPI